MRLIIAEDDALLAIDLTDAVEDAGHEVLCCEPSADAALRCAEDGGADLALVNISLIEGRHAGIELARRLLEGFDIPSIFVSGQREDAVGQGGFALGYLPKPYGRQDLVRAIEIAEVLQQGGKPPPPRIPFALELF